MKARARMFWNKVKLILLKELHANTSPLQFSLSLALGILVGFSPFYGFHTPIVLALAFLFRLNRVLALAAASTTMLPFVPLWLAAGIFTGKLVMRQESAAALAAYLRRTLPIHNFDAVLGKLMHLCKHLLTPRMFKLVARGSDGHMLNSFVQWLVGCCVLAVVSAIVTFVVSYLIWLWVLARRKKRDAMRATLRAAK